MSKRSNTIRGQQAEEQACCYLQGEGLVLLQRNYRLRGGEIDLIMQDNEYLVFIEVRYRQSNHFGGALYSINARKQQRIIKTAQHFLLKHSDTCAVRFDVVAVTGNNELEWIQNAFDAI